MSHDSNDSHDSHENESKNAKSQDPGQPETLESQDFKDDYVFEDSDEDQDESGRKSGDDFARMLEESLTKPAKKLSIGDKIRGEILVAGKEEVFVSTGATSDGVVSRRDLLDKEGNFPYSVGDKLDLYVVQVRGTTVSLSPKPTSKNLANDLQEAFAMKVPVEGRVSEICKGGVRVTVKGKSAFCPISQLDRAFIENAEEYIGKKFEFMITQFAEGGRNIVVSRRKLLDEQRGANSGAFQTEHKPGDIMTGKVTRMEKFGAFIEIAPGVEGMAHISEISWARVSEPQEVLSMGQEVTVKILKMDTEGDRLKISLSIKQAEAGPWENLPERIKVGAVVEGKVTRLMKFGAFVQIVPGIEGLVPLSEMSYSKHVVRAEEFMKEGETVPVLIKEISPEAKRVLLSYKDAGPGAGPDAGQAASGSEGRSSFAGSGDPWSQVAQKYPVGTVLKGKIERREAYGLFISLEEGVTGLFPKSKAHEHPEFKYDRLRAGETVTVQVAELKIGERRISLQVPGEVDGTDWKEFTGKSSGSFGTLADSLKAAMEKKKK